MTLSRQTVVYATDGGYWDHTFISLYSLLDNNRDVPLDVRILADAPDEAFFRHVTGLRDLHPDAEISWLPVDGQVFADAPTARHFKRVNYYRLLIGSLLPESIRRILYLDGDTIVRRPLRELFALDLDDWVVAASPVYLAQQTEYETEAERLGLPDGTPYFNSGVLVINLDRWRELRIEDRCFDYIRENQSNPVRLEFVDQDALNGVLIEKWLRLSPLFNFTEWDTAPYQASVTDSQIQLEVTNPERGPVIVHFAGGIKPWHGAGRHPYEGDYWNYRQQTPYADRRLLLRSNLARAMRRGRRTTIDTVRALPGGERALGFARSVRSVLRGMRNLTERKTASW